VLYLSIVSTTPESAMCKGCDAFFEVVIKELAGELSTGGKGGDEVK
jgi:hypothetical protein